MMQAYQARFEQLFRSHMELIGQVSERIREREISVAESMNRLQASIDARMKDIYDRISGTEEEEKTDG